MGKNNSNTLMFLSGAIVGAASVYFLKSAKGKKIINLLLEQGESIKEDITEQTDTILNKGKEKAEEVLDSGNELLEKAEIVLTKLNGNDPKELMNPQSEFEDGIAKAISNLKNA